MTTAAFDAPPTDPSAAPREGARASTRKRRWPAVQAPIAYLNTEYPSLSHTFIEREIRELRRLGLSIRPFSIRRPGKHGTIGGHHAAAATETTVLLDSRARLLWSAFRGALAQPVRTAKTLAASQRLSPPGMRQRFLHMVYAAEAVRLARELAPRSIRHIHVHMANNGAAVAMLACAYDPRLSWSLSIHGSAEFFQVDTVTLGAKAESALFTRCISDFCRAQVMCWSDARKWADFHVVHCGLNLDQFAPAQARRDGPLRLVTVGRLHSIKAYPLLVEACAELSSRGIDWTLDMIGDGPDRPAIESAVRRLGVESRVRLVGPVPAEELRARLASSEILIISSFMEGVPVVLMEAMAMGMPVLSTAVGGVPELVSDGVSGVLVAPGSSARLADGLERLAARRSEFDAMGRAGRDKIAAEFTIEETGRKMLALFERYLGPDATPKDRGAAP